MSETVANFIELGNARAVDRAAVPVLSGEDFRTGIIQAVGDGLRIASFFGLKNGDITQLIAVLADDSNARLHAAATDLSGQDLPCITAQVPQAHLFEREIAEQFGLKLVGHPWPKPVRFPAGGPVIGDMDFYRVQGDEVHEVAVGPIHAGIIEPGHFRFQCHGEQVFHLEISLGYQHRGVERTLIGGPNSRSIHYAQTLAGDTTIGHATCYCQAVEAISHVKESPRAAALRGIALELERLANHVGDLGAMAGDVGYLPTSSYCGRIRGDFLNMTALLCGNRFGRGLVRPGGVSYDVDDKRIETLLTRLSAAKKDTTVAIELLWDAPSVMARFEDIGKLSTIIAEQLGIVGPPARACGLMRDVRQDHPTGIYRFAHIPVSSVATSDVFARAFVRWLEIQRSIAFIAEQLQSLPVGRIQSEPHPLLPNQLAVSLVEGWRGEICHTVLTNDAGTFARYKVVDPSFHNWTGLAMVLRDQQISDFPLCNKSFNLSYCGHDL